MRSQYFNRVLIGTILFALAYAINYFSPVLWSLVVLLVYLLGFQEFKSLCNNMGIYPQAAWINLLITFFILLPLSVVDNYSPQFVYTFQVCLIITSYVVLCSSMLLKTSYTKFEDITTSLWAIFHMGLLPSFFTWIRIMDNGFLYTLTIIIAIVANDSGSLVFGKIFGKTKLAPDISPGKTVAGSLGGLFSGTLAFWLCYEYFDFGLKSFFWQNKLNYLSHHISGFDTEVFALVVVLVLGLLFAIVAQVGDLLVSSLKRAAGVKDSGNILSSHGGILDRVDSHGFAVWFAFFVFSYLLS